jgi:hypothetical protein
MDTFLQSMHDKLAHRLTHNYAHTAHSRTADNIVRFIGVLSSLRQTYRVGALESFVRVLRSQETEDAALRQCIRKTKGESAQAARELRQRLAATWSKWRKRLLAVVDSHD